MVEARGESRFASSLLGDPAASPRVPAYAPARYKTVHRTVFLYARSPLRVRLPTRIKIPDLPRQVGYFWWRRRMRPRFHGKSQMGRLGKAVTATAIARKTIEENYSKFCPNSFPRGFVRKTNSPQITEGCWFVFTLLLRRIFAGTLPCVHGWHCP